MVILIGSDFLW